MVLAVYLYRRCGSDRVEGLLNDGWEILKIDSAVVEISNIVMLFTMMKKTKIYEDEESQSDV